MENEEEKLFKILEEIFEAHGIESTEYNGWLLPNNNLPAVKAYWYPDASEHVGQLTIELLMEEGENEGTNIIVESFAGMGKVEDRLNSALDNFMRNSLHPFLSAFWDNSTKEITVDKWEIGGEVYSAYIGDYGVVNRQGDDFKIPDDYFEIIKKAICDEKLESNIHWFNLFYANFDPIDNQATALMDNVAWDTGSKAITSASWSRLDGYYHVREFIILRRER